jgi:hypothetical protein
MSAILEAAVQVALTVYLVPGHGINNAARAVVLAYLGFFLSGLVGACSARSKCRG